MLNADMHDAQQRPTILDTRPLKVHVPGPDVCMAYLIINGDCAEELKDAPATAFERRHR